MELVNRLETALGGAQTPSQRAERELEKYLRQGYVIVHKDEERVQLIRKKKFSFLLAFLGLLCWGFGLAVYVLYYLAKRDRVATIRLR